jgi:hypothetical protein
MQIKTTSRFQPNPNGSQNANEHQEAQARARTRGRLCTAGRNAHKCSAMESSVENAKKLSTHLPYDPVQHSCTRRASGPHKPRDTCTPGLTAAPFTTTISRSQPGCLAQRKGNGKVPRVYAGMLVSASERQIYLSISFVVPRFFFIIIIIY